MQTLPISAVKDKLSEYVEAVSRTAEQITITKNGSPVAVLVGADEWQSLQETLYWLTQPGILDDISGARRDADEGRTFDENEIREQFNVPKRPSE